MICPRLGIQQVTAWRFELASLVLVKRWSIQGEWVSGSCQRALPLPEIPFSIPPERQHPSRSDVWRTRNSPPNANDQFHRDRARAFYLGARVEFLESASQVVFHIANGIEFSKIKVVLFMPISNNKCAKRMIVQKWNSILLCLCVFCARFMQVNCVVFCGICACFVRVWCMFGAMFRCKTWSEKWLERNRRSKSQGNQKIKQSAG